MLKSYISTYENRKAADLLMRLVHNAEASVSYELLRMTTGAVCHSHDLLVVLEAPRQLFPKRLELSSGGSFWVSGVSDDLLNWSR
jgi:hypothetical protein